MAKWDAVGFGADNAEVEPAETFSTYDEAAHGIPKPGIYRMVAKRLSVGVTGDNSANPGSPKLVMVLEINEPKGTKKAIYNGYSIWLHRPVDKEYAARVNQVLLSLLDGTKLTEAKRKAVLKAFWEGKVVYDDKTKLIQKIGTWNVPDSLEVAASTRVDANFGDGKQLSIGQLMPISDAPKPVEAEPEDEEDDELDDEDVEPEEDDEELEDEEDDEEDEEDEDEGTDEDARFDELMDLGRAGMRKLAKELGIRVTTKMADEDLANAIIDAEMAAEEDEPEEEEEDDEPEPEPVKRRGPSGRASAKPAPKSRPAARRRKGTEDDEPPF